MKAVLSLGSAQNLVIAYSTHEVRKDQLCRFTKAFQCHTNLAQNTILVGVQVYFMPIALVKIYCRSLNVAATEQVRHESMRWFKVTADSHSFN